jgi:hypothetical protein
VTYTFFLFLIYLYINRVFNSSKEVKNLWKFTSELETIPEMIESPMLQGHVHSMVKTLHKIIMLMTRSTVAEQDKRKLIDLGKRHYHYGLKKEHFKVYIYI